MKTFDTKRIKVDVSEDLVIALDSHKGEFSMNRSAFMRYLIRRGFATIGVDEDDIEEMATKAIDKETE